MSNPYSIVASCTPIVALVAFSYSTAVAQDVHNLVRTAKPGASAHLGGYSHLNKSCDSQSLPMALLEMAPEHGRICFRPQDVTASHLYMGLPSCLGHRVPGISVEYQANEGYSGNDEVQYLIVFSKGNQQSFSVELIVLPGESDAAEPNASLGKPLQEPGLMPECPEGVS
jgi:hypothetical protein